MSASHAAGPPAERLRGPVSRLAADAKLVGLLAFLLVVAVTPADRPLVLAAAGAIAVGTAALAFADWRAVLPRFVLDAPLAVLAAAYALGGRGPDVQLLGLGLSRAGLTVGLAILAKASIGIVAVSAVAASTSTTATIDGLGRLGTPPWFRQLLALAARQLQVVRADLQRLRLAGAVRGGRSTWTVATRSLGSLFVRSAERAERLQLATDLRGGSGPPPASRPVPSPGWLAALAPAALLAVALVVVP